MHVLFMWHEIGKNLFYHCKCFITKATFSIHFHYHNSKKYYSNTVKWKMNLLKWSFLNYRKQCATYLLWTLFSALTALTYVSLYNRHVDYHLICGVKEKVALWLEMDDFLSKLLVVRHYYEHFRTDYEVYSLWRKLNKFISCIIYNLLL